MRHFIRIFMLLILMHNAYAHETLRPTTRSKLHLIEQKYHIKAGIYAVDTNNERVIAHNEHEQFSFQSTCKFIGVAALLVANMQQPLLNKKISIHPQDLVYWHPISGKYLNQQVSLKKLAEGAVSYSDNTAINKIMLSLGGLKAINTFAHSIGNSSFNITHYEADLNSDARKKVDTTTPQEMAKSIQKILLGSLLDPHNKALLLRWMRNNTTGYQRIRAGVPLGWAVADKTGSGSFGVANDIGIAWSPACKPVILSIFTKSEQKEAKPNDRAVAEITRVIFNEFARNHACYHEKA